MLVKEKERYFMRMFKVPSASAINALFVRCWPRWHDDSLSSPWSERAAAAREEQQQ